MMMPNCVTPIINKCILGRLRQTADRKNILKVKSNKFRKEHTFKNEFHLE